MDHTRTIKHGQRLRQFNARCCHVPRTCFPDALFHNAQFSKMRRTTHVESLEPRNANFDHRCFRCASRNCTFYNYFSGEGFGNPYSLTLLNAIGYGLSSEREAERNETEKAFGKRMHFETEPIKLFMETRNTCGHYTYRYGVFSFETNENRGFPCENSACASRTFVFVNKFKKPLTPCSFVHRIKIVSTVLQSQRTKKRDARHNYIRVKLSIQT